MAALDFIGGEIAVATVYGLAGVEIIATPEVLPTLATAAAALDSADLPEQFHLVEGQSSGMNSSSMVVPNTRANRNATGREGS